MKIIYFIAHFLILLFYEQSHRHLTDEINFTDIFHAVSLTNSINILNLSVASEKDMWNSHSCKCKEMYFALTFHLIFKLTPMKYHSGS